MSRRNRKKRKTPQADNNSYPIQGNLALKSEPIAAGQTKPQGVEGTVIMSGNIHEEEWNQKLQRELSYGGPGVQGIYDEMRTTDPQMAAAVQMVTLPIRQAKWKFEPASDSAKHREQADFCDGCFFEWNKTRFDDYMRTILLHLVFGFMIIEPIFKYDPNLGKKKIYKFGTRMPKTIHKWEVDEYEELDYVIQKAYKDQGWQDYRIDRKNFIHFARDQEANNFEGQSLIRPMYGDFISKRQIKRVIGIGVERFACGIPVMELPQGSLATAEHEQVNTALANIRAHEKAYLKTPFGYKFRIEGGHKGNQLSVGLDMIKYYDSQIIDGILANFMGLGKGETGTYALAQVQEGTFYLALQTVVDYIQDVHNMGEYSIVRKLIDMNFANVDEYPHLVGGNLKARDPKWLADSVKVLSDAGMLTPRAVDEVYFRDSLDMPYVDITEIEKEDEGQEPAPPAVPDNEPPPPKEPAKPEPDEEEKPDGTAIPAKNLKLSVHGRIAKDSILKDVDLSTMSVAEVRELRINDGLSLNGKKALCVHGFWRDPTPAEEHILELKAIERNMDESKTEYIEKVNSIRTEAAEEMAETLAKKIENGDIRGIRSTKIRMTGKVQRKINQVLKNEWNFGRNQIEEENERAKKRPDIVKDIQDKRKEEEGHFDETKNLALATKPKKITRKSYLEIIEEMAAQDASLIMSKVETTMVGAAIDGVRRDMTPEEALAALTSLANDLPKRDLYYSAGKSTHVAFGMARESKAEELNLENATFSSILDDNTCGPCETADGRTFKVGTAQDTMHDTPYRLCHGQDLCRCIKIYTHEGET